MKTPPRAHAWRAVALIAFVAGLLAVSGSAATHQVRNAAEFNALPALNAGDVVILHDGTYGALDKTVTSNIADDATAQANPIYVVAASPGGVRVAAPSRITLRGRGIVLAGLDFVAGGGMRDNGGTSPAWIIRTDINSRHMRISHVRFDHCTAGDDYGNWILLSGFNNVVEYCSFVGQDEPVSGATLSMVRSVAEAGIDVPRNHVIRYNYFGPRVCSSADNGYETIRIGDSGSQAHDMGVTIERNVFYRSIWRNDGTRPNEPEIISNKSKGNLIRQNTFLESYGQITLRHGDNCVVEGNFVFGGGYYNGSAIALSPATNLFQSGVRVVGQHHIVRNNYFVNLRGTGERAAVAVYSGYPGFNDGDGSGGDSTYEAAHHLQLYHNTFIDCRELRFGSAPRVEMTESPIGVTVYDNAWQGGTGGNALVTEAGFVPGSSGGNYFYRPAGDFGWTGLVGTYSSTVSPQITEAFQQYFIPTSTSPLLDVATGTLSADNDIRGAVRPATGRDIGSFEREASGGDNRPLLRNEVGPVFDGGSTGTYPQPPAFPLTVLTTTMPVAKTTKTYPGTLQAFGGTAPFTWSLT
ncbi:MAG TPA: polysaccharide lyase 6 family protein, partial [Lacunisphaera sp.]|nr:polysaccharide lyase 6 family protein [Lacunisphaera sp.]